MTNRRQSERGQDQRAAAEDLAIAALGFIAGEAPRLGRLPARSRVDPRCRPAWGARGGRGRSWGMPGSAPVSFRGPAREPQSPLGVRDHPAADEALLLAFAAENATDPGEVIKARDTIAGRRWERDTP